MARVRIGVIGAGWWSTQSHIPGLLEYEHCRRGCARRPRPGRPQPCGRALRPRPHVSGPPGAPRGRRRRRRGRLRPAHLPLRDRARRARRRRGGPRREADGAAGSRGVGSRRAFEGAPASRSSSATRSSSRAWRRGRRQVLQGGEIGDLLLVSGLFASMVQSLFDARPDDYAHVFEFPAHRAEAGHLLGPRDLGWWPGADPDHARHGDGAVGDGRRARPRSTRG